MATISAGSASVSPRGGTTAQNAGPGGDRRRYFVMLFSVLSKHQHRVIFSKIEGVMCCRTSSKSFRHAFRLV